MDKRERNALIVRAYEVHSAATVATTDNFLAALGSVKTSAKTYAFKHRIKSSHAIESKVRRKRVIGRAALKELTAIAADARDAEWEKRHREAEESATYSADNVTDVLGCRYVTLYQSEIPRIVEELLKAVQLYNDDPANNPIYPSEFVIYTNRTAQDPLSIVRETQRIVQLSPLFKDIPSDIRAPESRKSAYSSVHFVFSHDVEVRHAGKGEVNERTSFEIQIRDIFEEGWGEVQHDLIYSEKDRFGEELPGAVGEQQQWALHLNALKTFVDGCSQHASIIKANLESLRAAKSPSTVSQSVSERRLDLEHVIQALRRVKAKLDVERKVSLGYNLLISTGDLVDEVDAQKRLADAARNLSEAYDELPAQKRNADVLNGSPLTIGYYLRMETAAAKILAAERNASDGEALRDAAGAIYEDIAGTFKQDPTVHMRLGKSIERRAKTIADFDRAAGLYEQAITLLDGDIMIGRDHWLAISSRVDKGQLIWKRSRFQEDALDTGQKIDRFKAAATATLEAFHVWQKQSPTSNELNKVVGHKAASNIIYYLAGAHRLGEPLDDSGRTELLDMIAHVESYGGELLPDWYKTRDNLLHGWRAVGEMDKARALALENFTELRGIAEKRAGGPLDRAAIRNHLQDSEVECFETAAEMLGL